MDKATREERIQRAEAEIAKQIADQQEAALEKLDREMLKAMNRCSCPYNTPMVEFSYRMVNSKGEVVEGRVYHHSVECAESFLRGLRRNCQPLYPED